MSERKRVLVVGGCGFVGSHVVDRLLLLGADVEIVDDLSTCRIDPETDMPRFLPMNVTVHPSISKVGFNYDTVVYAATRYPLEREAALVKKAWRDLVDFTNYALSAMTLGLVKRFVVVSSFEVDVYVTERDPYRAVMRSIRPFLQYWHRPPNFEVYFTHFPTLVGPRQIADISPVLDGLDARRVSFDVVFDVEEAAKVVVDVALGKSKKSSNLYYGNELVEEFDVYEDFELTEVLESSGEEAAAKALAWYREEGEAE